MGCHTFPGYDGFCDAFLRAFDAHKNSFLLLFIPQGLVLLLVQHLPGNQFEILFQDLQRPEAEGRAPV